MNAEPDPTHAAVLAEASLVVRVNVAEERAAYLRGLMFEQGAEGPLRKAAELHRALLRWSGLLCDGTPLTEVLREVEDLYAEVQRDKRSTGAQRLQILAPVREAARTAVEARVTKE